MTTTTSFTMLRNPADFAAFGSGSRGRNDDLFAVRVRANGLAGTRVGFATGKNLGDAVTRNRVRRRLRVVLRTLGPRLVAGQDLLIIARPGAAAATSAAVGQGLERLLGAAGALTG